MQYTEYMFYVFAVFSVYSYFLYPFLLNYTPKRKQQTVADFDKNNLPSASLIITVHNEQERIREKLETSLAIDYPQDRLEIIIASDFSTDDTDSIVESFAEKNIKLVRADERKGKEYAQLCAIRESRGGIIVFSDVATLIPADALRLMVKCFADENVGAVSSEDQFISNDGEIAGEGAYVKYEMWLRRMESDRAGLIGLSGSFFAARREVCEQWDISVPSDFSVALNCAKQGLVAITCAEVLGIYKDVKDPSLEYQRKMRTVIRGITAIARHPEVFNPFRMPWFFFQVCSHKLMRWGVPWFMLALAMLTLMLQGQGMIYELALYAQLLFYSLAFAGWVSLSLRKNALINLVFFFVKTNIALAQATLFYISGKRMTTWTPSKR
jgi:hypothetical protein